MKTTLALLISAILFVTLPALASAHDRYDGKGYRDHQSRYEKDYGKHRHDSRYRKAGFRQHRYMKRDLHETRKELRQIKRELRHERRPYYVRSGAVFGLPHVIFRFDW